MACFHKKGVRELSPDAMIFIQGQESIITCLQCQKRSNNSNDVTNFSIDLPIDGISAATLNIATPRHDPERWYANGRSKIKLMSEIEIYVRGRFNVQGTTEPTYYPVFWGIVTKVSKTYSGGKNGLGVSCMGMLRWWQLGMANVNPSAVDQYMFPSQTPTSYSSIFATLNPLEIAVVLARYCTGGLFGPKGFNDKAVKDDKTREFIRQLDIDMMDYWQNRFSRLGRALRVITPDGSLFDIGDLEEFTSQRVMATRKKTRAAHWKSIGSINRLTALGSERAFDFAATDPATAIENYLPQFGLGVPSLFQSTLTPKLEIMNEIKNTIHYEFYQDSTGEIVFKPPFYNLKTRSYPPFVIEDIDIISESYDEDEAEVLTRVDVQGSVNQLMESKGSLAPQGFHVDPQLLRDYGLRAASITMPVLGTPESCYLYAVGELDRLNARRIGGSVTIMGRPEIRLGFPVFIPGQNAYYYVKHVSHSFTFGGTFTTTLGLEAARRPVYDIAGNLKRNHIFKGTGAATSSNANPNDKYGSPIPSAKQIADAAADFKGAARVIASSGTKDRFAATTANTMGFVGTYAPTAVMDNDVLSITIDPIRTERSQVEGTDRGGELRFPYTDEEGFETVGGYQYGRSLRVNSDGDIVNSQGVRAGIPSVASSVDGSSSSVIRVRQAVDAVINIQDASESAAYMAPGGEYERGPTKIPDFALEAGNTGLGLKKSDRSPLLAMTDGPDTVESADFEYCDCNEVDGVDRLTSILSEQPPEFARNMVMSAGDDELLEVFNPDGEP